MRTFCRLCVECGSCSDFFYRCDHGGLPIATSKLSEESPLLRWTLDIAADHELPAPSENNKSVMLQNVTCDKWQRKRKFGRGPFYLALQDPVLRPGNVPRSEKKLTQVPVEPGFAVTAHKAQGQTVDKVVVDLAGCSGTEQPYVMVLRSTSIEGLIILREFDFNQITKRYSEDLRKEFSRLECLRLQTVIKHGLYDEGCEARVLLGNLKGSDGAKKRKWAAGEA